MLRNLKSPETYFQTAFRVQSPWTITDDNGKQRVMKQECYVFDFALDRALRQISDYSCRLNVNEDNPEKKVDEFINFLPVLAYDGSTMKQISAQDVLDIALAGTSATLLARRWESALLVNVDNETLKRLLNNKEALDALMKIEGFRALNQDIETIINKSEHVQNAKKKNTNKDPKKQKELSDVEKELKSKRKQIQEKLIKFATRIPVFMYLTDYRERSLKDVITQLEPGLFKKVTGLDVGDFNTLCTLNVFNASLMNDAIFKFKRYEDSSLSYTGVNRHEGRDVGGWDTVLKKQEYEQLYYNQQSTMSAPEPAQPEYIEHVPIEFPPKLPKPAQPKPQPIAPKPQPTAPQSMPTRPTAQPLRPTTPPGARPIAPLSGGSAQPTTPAAPKTPSVDYAKVVVGAKVKHKAFGVGRITKIYPGKDKMEVSFGTGTKLFIIERANPNNVFDKGFLRLGE